MYFLTNKISLTSKCILLSALFLLNACTENYHLTLDNAEPTEAALDLSSSSNIEGTTKLEGSCFPEGSTINVSSADFDSANPGPFECSCVSNRFDCGNANISSSLADGEVPEFVVTITDLNGNTNTSENAPTDNEPTDTETGTTDTGTTDTGTTDTGTTDTGTTDTGTTDTGTTDTGTTNTGTTPPPYVPPSVSLHLVDLGIGESTEIQGTCAPDSTGSISLTAVAGNMTPNDTITCSCVNSQITACVDSANNAVSTISFSASETVNTTIVIGSESASDSDTITLCDRPNDQDCDGSPNDIDIDNDNDGIIDLVEIGLNYAGQIARWSSNPDDSDNGAGVVGHSEPAAIDEDFATNVSNLIAGPGITISPDAGNYAVKLSGLDSDTLALAKTNNDYVDISFDTLLNTGDLTSLAMGLLDAPAQFGYKVSIEASKDNFATPGVLVLDDQILPNDAGGTGYLWFQTPASQELLIEPNSSYIFRIFVYANPAANGGTATFNDLHLFYDNRGSGTDSDEDGIDDRFDLDSDNDGISDLFESGANPTIIAADTNSDGTISPSEAAAANGGVADLDGDGLLDLFDQDTADTSGEASIGLEPVDSDGDLVPDFIDLDSDDDGIADTIEARPTAGYVVNDGDVSNDDADGDGIISLFDLNDATTGIFGGGYLNFNQPNDQDGDGIPDYLDDDSDNDTLLDVDESGIAAASDATSLDPDGSVTTPTADLGNQTGDTSEVGYRE